jgi:anti-sigma factor RsiW
MTERADFSDTDLSAWLDGEGDAEQRARVAAHLRHDAAAAAKVRLWQADRDALRARFDAVRGEAVPPRLAETVHNGSRGMGLGDGNWARAAMAAGLLVAGGVIGSALTWQWQQQRTERLVQATQAGTAAGWVQRAAYAHSVFTPEPRHPVEVKAQEEHLSRWLTRRIDVPVKLFDLRDEGFELMGGRLLPDAQGKSAQLMYENAATKERVTVYLRKPEADAPTTFRYVQQGDVGLFYWVEAGAGYALVGTARKERLLALARAIYRQGLVPAVVPSASAPAR